jgi:DNA-directed RNA polymerase specialized sigma24 family protein
MSDGRQSQERHPRAKVSDDVVRQARDLREVHGLTFRQVAAQLGQPYETVRKWLRYTRRPYLRQQERPQ